MKKEQCPLSIAQASRLRVYGASALRVPLDARSSLLFPFLELFGNIWNYLESSFSSRKVDQGISKVSPGLVGRVAPRAPISGFLRFSPVFCYQYFSPRVLRAIRCSAFGVQRSMFPFLHKLAYSFLAQYGPEQR
jgi:hypothetical protein